MASFALAACTASAWAVTPIGTISARLPEAAGEGILVDTASTGTVYVANRDANRVAIVQNGVVTGFITTGRAPRFLAYDGTAHRLYVSNEGDGTLTINSLDGVKTLPIGGSGPMVLGGNRLFVLRQGNNGEVAVVDPVTGSFYAIDTGSHTPAAMAYDPEHNRLYVSHDLSGDVRAIDVSSTSDHPPTVSIQVAGRPGPIVYDGLYKKVYVLSDDARGPIVEIDPATNAARPITMPGHGVGPRAIAVNGVTGTLYAGFSNEVVLYDIRTGILTFIPTAEVRSIVSAPVAGYGLVLDAANNLTLIEPRTMRYSVVALGSASSDLGFNFRTCGAFVSGAALTTVAVSPCLESDPDGVNAQALWWVPSESGWGMNVTHQGANVFATWFTYDAQGQPTWLVMSNAVDSVRNSYDGTLYRTTGPPFNSATFDPARVTRTPVGALHLGVNSVNDANIQATVDGLSIQKELNKQVFSSPVPLCGGDIAPGALPVYQDLWWNPSESGWGLNVAHQGNILFITWFTYDTDGKATWFVGSDIEKTGNATYAGTLYKTFGPPMTASPWDPSKVTRMPVGNATLTFRDDDNGTFAYTVNGLSGSKAITRQVFATPATRCR